MSIIGGIVVGAAIFKAPPMVFASVPSGWHGLGAWLVGGLLSLVGALCYAELAATYPNSGGEYVYLTRASGALVGFLFGWTNLVSILAGSIATLAYVVADYGVKLAGLADAWSPWIAAINVIGVALGTLAQNVLTMAKIVGLSSISLAALLRGGGVATPSPTPTGSPRYGLAMILVLYAQASLTPARSRSLWRCPSR